MKRLWTKLLRFLGILDDRPKIRVHAFPSGKLTEVRQNLIQAEARLGMNFRAGTIAVRYVPASDIHGRYWGKINDRGKLVAGVTERKRGAYNVTLYTKNDEAYPRACEHEMGHCVLYSNNIPGEAHENWLKREGFL